MKIKNQYNVFSSIKPIIELEGKEAKKLIKVVRLKEGSYFKVIDPLGNKGIYQIKTITKNKKVIANLIEQKTIKKEKKIEIIIGITKKKSLELLIKVLTQIGISDIVLAQTEYSLKPKENEIKKIMERLKRIGIETLKQAESILPNINYIDNLEKIEYNPDHLYILLDKEGEKNFLEIKEEIKNRKIIIFLGPEGDFSKKEKEYLTNTFNCVKIKLSDTILRTETAGIIAVSQLLLLI